MLYVIIIEYMSVVVNVMLSLMSVMSPPPALCNLLVHTVVKLCTLALGVRMLVWCLQSCGSPWSVCELVVVPYVVSAVVAVTVMHVLLFVLHVCMLRDLGCEGDGNAGVGVRGGVVAVSGYMGVTRGSGVCLVHVTCFR